ncbi:MAG: hypothetical protein JO236_08565 [Mycobacterium sp.]|uniref:hypothetical protein n=1 Tax=Mycobacterium sp. TaxID=1785 RepID=UPI001EC1488D|nr:hypothetical protein [Mycobacterium sp.]MBW0017580.1 hypothetical protein [Mycobacterium sp.]
MSQPPDYPGTPGESHGSHAKPEGYPPSPDYGTPPPGYGTPPGPPGYGAPPPPPPGYGQQPQPPGGYGPPPGGSPPEYGTPPPPPGPSEHGTSPAPSGYGAPPPPGYGAPPPGYATPPGYGPATPPFSVGDAFNWAWKKFTGNVATLVVPVVAYILLIGAIVGIGYGILFANTTTTNSTDDYGYAVHTTHTGALGIIAVIAAYLVCFLVGAYMQAAMISGVLDIADGKPVSIGTFFRARNLGPVLVTSLLLIVATGLGSLCIIGGLIIGFLTHFAVAFVVDRSLSPVNAVKASYELVKNNFVPVLLSLLVQYAVIAVGEIACFVGLFAAVPVALLIQVYTYRKLSGGQVVPLEQAASQPGPPAGLPPAPPPGQQPA